MTDFDVAVCGVGAIGSAALYHLARRGLRTIGIEQASPGHEGGSSHGTTRIIRLSYFEHPSYVPLLRHAYALWRDLERAAGRTLLHQTGILEIGPEDGTLAPSTLAATRLHDLRHEMLSAAALMTRYPVFHVPDNFIAVLQPDGGFLEASVAIQAHVVLAQAHGAVLHIGETVQTIEPHNGGVQITTDLGRITASAAVVAAGPWLAKLLPGVSLPLRVTRQAFGYFVPPDPTPFTAGRCPVFLLESRHGIHYGIPFDAEPGLKVAKHHHADATVDPDAHERTVTPADEALMRGAVAEHVPAANGPLVGAKTCLYTMTPDGDFILDRLPACPQIVVASPCSGHGFKFAPLIGEILADLATTGATGHDISRFRLSRFG